MGCKVLCLSVALLLYLMICKHVRAQCTQPSFPSRNVVLSDSSLTTQSFSDGSTVTFECVVGHIPLNPRASKSVTCKGTQWTSLELDCTRKSCGSPPDFLNGRYEKTGILFGDKITAVCNTGYVLAGLIKDRWCRDQGWDGRDPVCEVVKCEAPPAIENGHFEDELLESYDYLQAVSYKCNSGFSLAGSSSLHCSDDGTFKPDPPRCVDGCPKPEIPHAIRIGGKSPPYKLGNFIDYKCEDGYSMKGENHIVCTTNGWSPELPKCIGPCNQPEFGGHVTLTEEFRSQKSFPQGSKVTFECISGYEPVESTVSKSVTCQETGWTELLFTCTELAQQCQRRFRGVETIHSLAASTFLDIRFKHLAFRDKDHVEVVIKRLLSEMQDVLGSVSVSTTSCASSVTPPMTPCNASATAGGIWEDFDFQVLSAQQQQSGSHDSIIEMHRYAEEKVIPRNQDPLVWGRNHEQTFPSLSKLAKKYLGITASSVPSERFFSKARELISQRRNRLKGKNLDILLFLNKNL